MKISLQIKNMQNPSVTIGIISYKDKKYLEKGIPTLLKQEYKNIEILICDNNEDPKQEIKKWIEKEFTSVKVVNAGGNVGFGNAHNYMINEAIKMKSKYYFAFNSDMFASKDLVSRLVKTIEKDKKMACVTPKLLQWKSFPKKPDPSKKQSIDSTGISITKSHLFFERGTGEEDKNQYKSGEIWGTSGAAPLFRIKALEEIQHKKGEFFDEDFFMYKEDTDLSYRFRWAGWKIYFESSAIVWHDRTAEQIKGLINNIKERKSRPRYISEHSFLNQLQLLYKNFSSDFSITTKIKTFLFMSKYILFLILFDRKTLKQYKKFKKLKTKIREKRKTMIKKISAKEMEKWFI